MTAPARRRRRRIATPVLLGLILALAGFTVPNSTIKPADMVLVQLERASSVDTTPDVVWVLAVGSDARPGEDMTRTRGDALQLIGINTKTGAGTSIGIPRDSYVTIPGYGSDRVNAALYYGGPRLLGETVGNLIGIQPEYVFVAGFETFRALVRNIGGITVDNPREFSDFYLKELGFPAGRIELSGYDALAFSRIRKSLPAGDFDRSANQQRVLRGILDRVRAQAGERGFIERAVMSVLANTDTAASPRVLFNLAHAVTQVRPGLVTTCVVQGAIGNIGGASVVLPYTDQAQRYGDEARDDATIESC